jgi:hypothetical protein
LQQAFLDHSIRGSAEGRGMYLASSSLLYHEDEAGDRLQAMAPNIDRPVLPGLKQTQKHFCIILKNY